MTARFFTTAALTVSLSMAPGLAQTPAELLQKGIYAQETAGDLDSAVQIYRQIVASASNQPAIAAQAQFRLTQSLLQKEDFNGVRKEFDTLVRNYPDQQSLVNEMGEHLRTIAANGPAQLLGYFQNGKYHHYWTGVELTAPAGWTFTSQRANADGWDRVDLVDPTGHATTPQVVMTKEPGPKALQPAVFEPRPQGANLVLNDRGLPLYSPPEPAKLSPAGYCRPAAAQTEIQAEPARRCRRVSCLRVSPGKHSAQDNRRSTGAQRRSRL
jgi:hypothetical protein